MNRKLSIRRLAVVVLVVVALIGLVGCGKVRAIDDAVKRGDLETVMARDKEVAELLLANKAEVDAKDSDGATPLQYAAAGGCKDLVELLLVNKADVNAKAKDGRTPLDVAAAMDHKDVVELLRQHGGHK